jgi:hypothetical protein
MDLAATFDRLSCRLDAMLAALDGLHDALMWCRL